MPTASTNHTRDENQDQARENGPSPDHHGDSSSKRLHVPSLRPIVALRLWATTPLRAASCGASGQRGGAAMTGESADHLRFVGWDQFSDRVPRGATMLRQSLDRYRQECRPQFLAEYA